MNDNNEVLAELIKKVESLDNELSLLRDKETIRDVIARYCRSIDRMDRELLTSCFHPNAVAKYGLFEGERDAFVDWAMESVEALYIRTYYLTRRTIIDIDGDEARCESYIFAPKELQEKNSDGNNQLWVGAARFLDRFEKRNGQWRITSRALIAEWGFIATVPSSGTFGPYEFPHDPAIIPEGQRGKSDPVYSL